MIAKTKKNNFKNKIIFKRILKILFVIFFISIAIKIYFVYMQNLESENELQNLQKKLEKLLAENENLEDQIKTGLTPELVEKTAREKLKMVKPNESVYINIISED